MGARVMHRFLSLVTRFGRDESGVFAVLFGIVAIVLVALSGAVVDYVSLQQARNRAQIAIDAAALALQADIFDLSVAQIETRAQALVDDRLAGGDITADVFNVVVDQSIGSLRLEVALNMPTNFVRLVGVTELNAQVISEVRRGSVDLEVAVAVDLSNSMNNSIPDGNGGTTTKIASLKVALNQLIDLMVQDEQSPTYSKMALVPYSVAVNVGSYANAVRGAIIAPTAITNVTWFSATRTVNGAARTSNGQPVTITTSATHGFSTGDYVFIDGVRGTTQVNNKIFQITVTSTTKFTLNGTTSGTYSNYSNTGTVWKCLTSICELVVTSTGHGLRTGDHAYISGVGGMETFPTSYNNNSVPANYTSFENPLATDTNTSRYWINNNSRTDDYRFLAWKIGTATANTFVLPGTGKLLARAYGTYTSGGTVACVLQGCSQYLFTNPYNSGSNGANASKRRNPISTCVTERDINTFTNASYQTTLVGRNYPSAGNSCLADTILPLTSAKGTASSTNKSTLHGVANTLTASGSTGGQIGVAWAWYLLSAGFNGPWPSISQPAPDITITPVVKAVVIMTDGEYNSIYKNGVIAQNSTAGSGDTNSMIGQNANNGSSYEQTASLCAAMKAAGVTVFTVGLAIDDKPIAQEMMANCASDAAKAYVAGSGRALADVFAEIAASISELRITN